MTMETFNQLLLDYPELLYSGVGATAFVAGGAVIYKLATRKKPTHANVNCWFCNRNTVVPYGNRNCWDCPTCDQYNGFQENGDYNKPIPAQYMEHLNHGVSGSLPTSDAPKTLQWVNCQMLLCRKCNNNQSAKIKQLASFIPRDDENYDEEIEAYKHHLEQTYKLCRPCQTAVEYYIKYQNRQLRTVLLNHQLRRSRDSDKAFVKSACSVSSPMGVVLLRVLGFLTCAFLLATTFYEKADQAASPTALPTLSGGVVPPKPKPYNESNGDDNKSGSALPPWQSLLLLLPDNAVEQAVVLVEYGQENQVAVASVGLLTCITAIFLAGPVRLRRIDAVVSVLWFLIMCLNLSEKYWTGTSGRLEMAKISTTILCCLLGFAAAVATRKPMGPRRARYRRYLAGGSAVPSLSAQPPLLFPDPADNFVLAPPPNLSKLINRQAQSSRERKASPSSLPGRLNRALCLGTIPSLTRTDSRYLFSGSRPASVYKESLPSDYFSVKSASCPSSPGPSPTPSVAGSVTSSSGSARLRRPLISPARLNISGQKLRLFSSEAEPVFRSPPASPSHVFVEPTSSTYSSCYSNDVSPIQSQNDLTSLLKDGSVLEEKRCSSSGSSACQVDTTTGGLENAPPSKDLVKRLVWPGLLLLSLSTNLFFASVYMYHNWR